MLRGYNPGICLPSLPEVLITRVYASLASLRVVHTRVYASLASLKVVHNRVYAPSLPEGGTYPGVCLPTNGPESYFPALGSRKDSPERFPRAF